MANALLINILIGIVPIEHVISQDVDLIEINHFYDEQGKLVFDQIIFYNWSKNRFHVIAWRLVKEGEPTPRSDWRNNGYIVFWKDSGQGGEVLRCIKSKSIRETWTQYDPELYEREFLPKEQRLELIAIKCSK